MASTTSSERMRSLSGGPAATGDRQEYLTEIIERHRRLADRDGQAAAGLRLAFLQAVQAEPGLLRQPALANFLAAAIEPEDWAELAWESPGHLLRVSESLYQTRMDDQQRVDQINRHASLLLRRALRHYQQAGQMERMFSLLRLAPSYLRQQDPELRRLHHRAVAYEVRRVRRGRRFLYGYLLIQVVLVLFVFPLLFINAENGRLQRQVEELTDVELGDEGYQLLTFSEGVYWSVITAGSIGYGDITPRTTTGRIIAGALGIMGVITVGIVAGLVLDRITPRQIL